VSGSPCQVLSVGKKIANSSEGAKAGVGFRMSVRQVRHPSNMRILTGRRSDHGSHQSLIHVLWSIDPAPVIFTYVLGLTARFLWPLGCCVVFGRQFFYCYPVRQFPPQSAFFFLRGNHHNQLIDQKPIVWFSFKPEKKNSRFFSRKRKQDVNRMR